MKRICAWCAKIMCEGDGAISHGICPQCAERVLSDYPASRGGGFRKSAMGVTSGSLRCP
ncbi:MAG: hypothetical protein NTY64_12810 [Deltaproteobacteria bacterium]|nr:hypothetical protein [Deltaproteobacteria bacterium]